MRIGRVFGIDIKIHVSWLFVFALVTWTLASDVGPLRHLDITPGQRWLLGAVTSLLFFASVLIHELAHSLVARSRGIPIQGITLWIFGGVSSFEGEPTTAPSEAWIALVGPLASLVLAAIFYGLAVVVNPLTPLGEAFGYLALANLILGIFNILPAFPLDGGRVLHAVIWRATGDRLRATGIAVATGRVLAWLLIAYGIYETLTFGFGGGLWLTFIGWFLLQAGGAEAFQARLTAALAGHAVGELATMPAATVPANATVAEAVQILLKSGQSALPVMLGDRFVGVVSVRELSKGGDAAAQYVTAVMTRAEDLAPLDPQSGAVDALHALAKSGAGLLPIVDKSGTLVGFVTVEGVMRWMSFERERTLRTVHSEHAA